MRLLVLIFLIGVGISHAQTHFAGRVVDNTTGEILPGVVVDCKSQPNVYTLTNDLGKFSMHLANPDTITFSMMGFHTTHYQSLKSDTAILIRLIALATEIKTIEITAERIIAEEFTMQKIKKLDIYTNPSAKADPILAVASSAASTTIDESANISLRGGSPDETGIFFNNVPIHDAVRYSQLNGIGTFSIFNTALVNSVLVYPGNPPLEYGNSTSGLIALQSDEKIPTTNTRTFSLTLASMGFMATQSIGSKSSISVFSNYQPSSMIKRLNREALEKLNNFSSIDLGIHFYSKPTPTSIIKIFNYSVNESYEFEYEEPSYKGLFFQNKQRNFTVANFRKRYNNIELSLNQGVSFSKADYQYSITKMNIRLKDLFTSVNIQQISDQFEWETGISYEWRNTIFNGTFPEFEFASGEDHPTVSFSTNDHIKTPETFIYGKYYIGKWIAGGGIRKNIPLHNHANFFSYQANVHYTPHDDWSINLAFGKYNKFKMPQEGENHPVLTTSEQLSLDIKRTKSSNESSLSFYTRKSTTTKQSTRVQGIEFFNRYKITQNLRTQFSITSLDAKDIINQITKPSPYNIQYFLRGNFEYKIKGTWTFTTVFLFRQGSYYRPVADALFHEQLGVYEPVYDDQSKRLPTYRTIDLSVSKLFMLTKKSTAIAFASAGNIFNYKNVREYTYSSDYSEMNKNLFSKRTVYFGLVINW